MREKERADIAERVQRREMGEGKEKGGKWEKNI